MSVKIEFFAETSAKAHEEMVEFARLFLGNTPVAQPENPRRDEPKTTGIDKIKQLVKEEAADQTSPVEDEVKEVKEDKPKTTRTRTQKPKVEEAKEEDKPVEKTEEVKEETKPVEKTEAKEESSTAGASNYGEGFEDCSNDEEVMNKVRAYVNTFNIAAPGNSLKAKALFTPYGVSSVPKLSVSQAIEFYHKLKAEG